MKNRRSNNTLLEFKSNIIIFIFDMLSVFISLYVGFLLANLLNFITGFSSHTFLESATGLLALYIVIPLIFLYEGIYTYRFDFWHELRLIHQGLLFGLIIVFAYLALIQGVENYSRSVIICSFFSMMIIIPLIKNIIKKKLFKIGLWKLGVKILNSNKKLATEIFNNPYLGYIQSRREEASIVFIDTQSNNISNIQNQLEQEIGSKNKVMFVPVFNNYQFSNSDIYEIDSGRTNVLVLQNKLNSKYRMFVNTLYNYILAIFILPFLLPVIGIIYLLVKLDSKGPAFFMQERLGADGKAFRMFKFRTMYINGEEILEKYLENNPNEIENYKIYHKYENDPRITKIGKILRNTSADELAQIFNVLNGDMNFVGPRPYMVTEKEKVGALNRKTILKVKPGITGLWQVNGRCDLTFEERVNMDKWYICNWSLWMDFIIFLKTINVVLNKRGAK